MKKTIQIAIQDANILIDLVTTGLFTHCLSLEYQFLSTNLILAELHDEQFAFIEPHIESGKFAVIAVPAAELVQIQLQSEEDQRLSIQDWSAFYYAVQREAILMTGDKRLRSMAETKGVAVCGILRLFDELTAAEIIRESEACVFLKKLMQINRRLPAEECALRIKKWCH
jgi:predicted nucleic acid-binding protein